MVIFVEMIFETVEETTLLRPKKVLLFGTEKTERGLIFEISFASVKLKMIKTFLDDIGELFRAQTASSIWDRHIDSVRHK